MLFSPGPFGQWVHRGQTEPTKRRVEVAGRMLKRIAGGILARMGYEIRQIPQHREVKSGLTLYQYLKADGSFDYEKYRQVQIEGNKRKLEYVWADEQNIASLSRYITSTIGTPKFGICHGTRRGKEQQWFRTHLGCDVIGTEISDTAEQFPHTIQWDFHEAKPEWIGATDFIYSNSFDHSYDPERCLDTWMGCLRSGGICILEHSNFHGPEGACELDPFGADIVTMPYLISKWGKGKYAVRELIEAARKKDDLAYLYFIVIQRL
jgi:hypothetical protein